MKMNKKILAIVAGSVIILSAFGFLLANAVMLAMPLIILAAIVVGTSVLIKKVGYKAAIPASVVGVILAIAVVNYNIVSTKTVIVTTDSVRLSTEEGGGFRMSYTPVYFNEENNTWVRDIDDSDQILNQDGLLLWFPFIKRNSGSLQGRIDAHNENEILEVEYYGWRFPLFSMFYNIIDIEKVGEI